MTGCGFESRLDAFHDGELSAAERARVAEHVAGCASCGAALQQMQQMSLLLGSRREDVSTKVSAGELARLHAAVDRQIMRSRFQVDPSFWRTAGVLSGLAASVLIVASAWLMETPAARQPALSLEPVALQPDWERIAMTLRADPLPYSGPEAMPDQSALADAHANMTDWMLENLKGRAGQ
jgi:anti-sigma factor RsiW